MDDEVVKAAEVEDFGREKTLGSWRTGWLRNAHGE